MFELAALTETLTLQQQSFELLRWINQSMRKGVLHFPEVHQNLDSAQACEAWLQQLWGSLPADILPDPSLRGPFSRILSSYLTTTYEPVSAPAPMRQGDSCRCNWCSWFVPGNHLKVRAITPRAREQAQELMKICLTRLIKEVGADTSAATLFPEIQKIPARRDDLMVLTYVQELFRRREVSGQGTATLVIWRVIAWKDNAPIKGFTLTAQSVLDAENRLTEAIRNPDGFSAPLPKETPSLVFRRFQGSRYSRDRLWEIALDGTTVIQRKSRMESIGRGQIERKTFKTVSQAQSHMDKLIAHRIQVDHYREIRT